MCKLAAQCFHVAIYFSKACNCNIKCWIDLSELTVQYFLCSLCLTSHQHLNENKEKKTPVVRYSAVSDIDSSHKARISDVKWLPPTFEVHRATGQRGLEGSKNQCTCLKPESCDTKLLPRRLHQLLNGESFLKVT